ncbi:MAG: hypothetical protein ACYSTS_16125 [Planctomycetota bacterium]
MNFLFFKKLGPSNLWWKAGPERIGTTMNSVKELTNCCKANNLLRYHIFLSKSRQVSDQEGLKLIEPELERVKRKFLYLESMGMFED